MILEVQNSCWMGVFFSFYFNRTIEAIIPMVILLCFNLFLLANISFWIWFFWNIVFLKRFYKYFQLVLRRRSREAKEKNDSFGWICNSFGRIRKSFDRNKDSFWRTDKSFGRISKSFGWIGYLLNVCQVDCESEKKIDL